MSEFEQRVIDYLEQSGWRVVDISQPRINPATFSNRYTVYADYLDKPVAGAGIGEAFCYQMRRDHEAGTPGRFLSFQ